MRLADGGRIDRTRPVAFTWDGRAYTGFHGDTLASALLANGVHLFGRSFKYHRPRGVLGAGVEEPNALVEVDRGPGRRDMNLPATTIELFDGLTARSQNRWPSLARDAGAVNDLIAPLIPAGFYYKTFKWPRSAWARVYEPLIRRAAGLGRAPDLPDPDRYAHLYDHADVVVVGAGVAGIGAALAASECGARVILCDEGAEPGGWLLADPHTQVEGRPAWDWLADALGELARRGVLVLPRTTAAIVSTGGMIGLVERLTDHLAGATNGPRQRMRQVRARAMLFATGAHERPIVFPGNDRPGVMLAGAARTFAGRYAALAGQRIVVLAAHDSGHADAHALARCGAGVMIADVRPAIDGALVAAAREVGAELILAARPQETAGRLRVRSITISGRVLPCDAVLMAGGWTPALHLHSQARGRVAWDETTGAYLPGDAPPGVHSAGAANGVTGLDEAFAQGQAAGARAAGQPERTIVTPPRRMLGGAGGPFAGPMAFVDFQNDVTAKDIGLAVREGFHSVEHFKRYTTTGMATDQGRTSNMNAMAVAGAAMGVPTGQVGITTYRAPYTPTSFGAFATIDRGTLFDPLRQTPIDPWAAANGAVFENVGLWRRARHFPRGTEGMDEAVRRECRTTRAAVGVFDASTLGKIEVVGPDAARFLELMYVNAWAKLGVGRCRYGVMLREDGFVYDDGVIGRIAENRFHVTTTTGGAAGVLNIMEDYLQTEVPHLRVWLTSTSEQWAVIAVQGPRARAVLMPLVEGIDLAPEAMPHMSVREGMVCGVPARLFRVSFTGEPGFEVNVPARHGLAVWEAIHARAAATGGCAYGTEAMHVLRAEKGYIIVGQESDGTATPDDLGLGWAIGKAKRDFVGKRSLVRPDMIAGSRKQLVGLTPAGHATVPDEGAQIVGGTTPQPFTSQGQVTSAYWSDAVGGPIALAMLKDGRARHGQTVFVTRLDGEALPFTVTGPVFLDPANERLNG